MSCYDGRRVKTVAVKTIKNKYLSYSFRSSKLSCESKEHTSNSQQICEDMFSLQTRSMINSVERIPEQFANLL